MVETILFYLIVGTIALGIGLDLGYRAWHLLTRPRQNESAPADSQALTEEYLRLPIDDA